ncbi:MAG TPA: addiction module protein [Chromatiaceae bacterium]|nr:addiction module protein [Chromatiaceae bacterium]
MNIAQIESEALSLPVDARASLAHRLLLSLEEISEPEFDRLWGEESARRAAEIDAGLAQAVPGDEVARKARALLR